jgi:A/G-specific adenine glycosylase
MEFNSLIINWYRSNKRSLPWRENKNPYFIWLSEVILQQTQVVQGMPYYLQFVDKYPTVKDLADAPQDDVLKLWQGLGYYSRARNLHQAAKYVAYDCKGVFPNSYKELLKMKGVGDYTASAIASIAFNEAVPTVDGNVLRVISRLFDVDTPVDSDQGKKEIKYLMNEHMYVDAPGDFNQAVMELGAMVCKPKNPTCETCPVQVKCLAHQNNTIEDRPVKTKKVKVSEQFVDYLCIEDKQGLVLLQRDASSIWKNLFEFPSKISDKPFKDLKHLNDLLKDYVDDELPIVLKKEMVHKLTHKRMHIRFFNALSDKEVLKDFTDFVELKQRAVPKPVELYLSEFVFKQ